MQFKSTRKLLVIVLLSAAGSGSGIAQQSGVREACANDYKTLCSGVKPGGGRIKACLQANAAKLSADCKAALSGKGAQ